LITTDIEVESVLDTAPRVSELEFMSEATESYKKIMNWKNVSLVSLERAKGEVND